jgi:Holliday junction resolvasome RuvABC endonuclease subunit
MTTKDKERGRMLLAKKRISQQNKEFEQALKNKKGPIVVSGKLEFIPTSKIKLLAIDPAERTGWAISKTEYGLWDLKPKRDENFAFKLLKLKAKLKEIVQLAEINTIVYERPSGHHANAVISHSKLVAVIEMFTTENNIPMKGYSAKEIKKFATDNGNANKEKMLIAARQKLGYIGEDDNEADALWLWCLAADDLNM